jgi:hypothetical protein
MWKRSSRFEPKPFEKCLRSFSHFLGVDQTGRRLKSGKAAPLPACSLTVEGEHATLKACDEKLKPLYLDAMTSQCVVNAVSGSASPPYALVLDCVFGLPEAVRLSQGLSAHPFDCFERLNKSLYSDLGYGREAASSFFLDLWSQPSIPARCIESIAGSNSVFRRHPFQRNIQTGTFRIWKDIATGFHRNECGFWPWDNAESGTHPFWFFEGYPSFFWRTLFGFQNRCPGKLVEKLESIQGLSIVGQDIISQSADHADAAVLAVGAWLLQRSGRLWAPVGLSPLPAGVQEGWILGVQH